MSTGTLAAPPSPPEYACTDADQILPPPVPSHEVERQSPAARTASGHLVVRVDVLGEMWSARVQAINAASALLHLHREVADRLKNDQPASICLESESDHPVCLDGSLRFLRPSDGTAPDEPASVVFARRSKLPIPTPK